MISIGKRWLQHSRVWRYLHNRMLRAMYCVMRIAKRITFVQMAVVSYLLLAGIGACLLWPRWDLWVGDRPLGEAIRDVAILAGALAGLLVATWRAQVADRQNNIADADLAYRRYQAAATMLRDQEFAVRFGAIQELEWLAKRYPKTLHVHVMRVLCAFIRIPKEDQALVEQCQKFGKLRDDVQQALVVLGTLHSQQPKIAREAVFSIDLRGANLEYANMSGLTFSDTKDLNQKQSTLQEVFHGRLGPDFNGANLAGANLTFTELSYANFSNANLSAARFLRADLSQASFTGANVTGASFHSADLSKVQFITEWENLPAIGLTQRQLDSAEAQVPPALTGMIDHETDEQLIWKTLQGKELNS